MTYRPRSPRTPAARLLLLLAALGALVPQIAAGPADAATTPIPTKKVETTAQGARLIVDVPDDAYKKALLDPKLHTVIATATWKDAKGNKIVTVVRRPVSGAVLNASGGRSMAIDMVRPIVAKELVKGDVAIEVLVRSATGNPCIARELADRNPDVPGLQYDCSVADVLNAKDEKRTENPIPECLSSGAPPAGQTVCWRFVVDPNQCPTSPGNRSVLVNRSGASVPLGTVLEVQCVTL